MITKLDVTDKVLEDTKPRALKFLGAVSRVRPIRAALATRGYTEAVHQKGYELTFAAVGYRRAVEPKLETPEANAALAKADAWDEPNFRIASVALAADFPEQHAFLFDDLEPATGSGAIRSIKTFLDRLDELENGKDRKATRKADQAAIAKLAERGIGEGERAHLRDLLAIITKGISDADVEAALAAAPPPEPEEERQAKLALRAWYVEWSEIAKVVIKRRDHLILLGLAKRKKGEKKSGEGGEK